MLKNSRMSSVFSGSRIIARGQTEKRAEADRERERETDRTKLPLYRNCKIVTLNSVLFLS